jgi:hypothetical protein
MILISQTLGLDHGSEDDPLVRLQRMGRFTSQQGLITFFSSLDREINPIGQGAVFCDVITAGGTMPSRRRKPVRLSRIKSEGMGEARAS